MTQLSTLILILAPITLGATLSANQSISETPSQYGRTTTSQGSEHSELPEGLAASDWSSIRAAYEANRHAAFEVEDGYQARNPGQAWITRFDGRGFLTVPDVGDWTWGLDLVSYGWGDDARVVSTPQGISTKRGRVAYAWDEQLTEWYENDMRGLEHGYTVFERPEGSDGLLGLELAIRGELSPVVSPNGRDVRFESASGATALNYAGLTVFDATGAELSAGFEVTNNGLRLVVQDAEARYPLTIDPVAQQAYLKASNAETNDYFGGSVAISGDTVVVGAEREDSGATGVDGNQGDNSVSSSGAAYVFRRAGGAWTQEAYLKASNAGTFDSFGCSVAISVNTIVVGAFAESSNATGVNGNQTDNSASAAGAAYVFKRSGTTWSQEAYLKASNAEGDDRFGNAVAISAGTVVVGTELEASNATGVNGNQNDNSAAWAGAAYVFRRSGTTWSQEAYLKASNTDPSDFFGFSVAVSGDRLVVGARGEASNGTDVNGNQSDDSVVEAGAAYVFNRTGNTWNQQAYLKASNTDAGDLFGFAVDIFVDTIVVGAKLEGSSASGVNGNQTDNSAMHAGAAYVFFYSGGVWAQQAYLKPSNMEAFDHFGGSVAIAGDTLLVAATGEDSNATFGSGSQSDNSASSAGAVYVYRRSGTTWNQQVYLKASNTEAGDFFGQSVSISLGTAIVAAHSEDSNAAGVNGDQGDNSASYAGAAYVFNLAEGQSGSAFCFGDGTGTLCPCGANGAQGQGCANTGGSGSRMDGTGDAVLSADTFGLAIVGGPANKPGLVLRASNQINGGLGILVGDGLLCIGGQSARSQVQVTNANGNVAFVDFQGLPFGQSSFGVGIPAYYQFWYRDPSNTCSGSGFNFSNAWATIWLP
ncbi:MAG: hypothetical protein ACI9F9_001383 [Candidatus Paceibacteria bacterium]|jgi:hypothetical protein